MRVTWDAAQVANARESAQGLFAVGVQIEGSQDACSGVMPSELCEKLVHFARALDKTEDPAKAFQMAFPEIPLRRKYNKPAGQQHDGGNESDDEKGSQEPCPDKL